MGKEGDLSEAPVCIFALLHQVPAGLGGCLARVWLQGCLGGPGLGVRWVDSKCALGVCFAGGLAAVG
ncbi:hypothetical protein U1Q18_008207, partial [Sarracenia purpurea var. burkii]